MTHGTMQILSVRADPKVRATLYLPREVLEEARNAAVRTALSEVLVRLSGDPDVMTKPAGKSL